MTNQTAIAAIDELGLVRAELANWKAKEDELKLRLADLPAGSYEGNVFRLNVIVADRDTPDATLKAKTKELVEQHLSRQFIAAHTNTSEVRTLRTGSRNGKSVDAKLAAMADLLVNRVLA